MGEKEKVAGHMGTKFLGLFFGILLAVIYTVWVFFKPQFIPYMDIPMILYMWAMLVIVLPLITFGAELLWRYAHKYSEKFPSLGTGEEAHLGTKFLGLFFGYLLAIIYTVKTFFNPAFTPILDTPYIIYVWAVFTFAIPAIIFLAELIWRYAHEYSEKFPA